MVVLTDNLSLLMLLSCHSAKVADCIICGERSTRKCLDCSKGFLQYKQPDGYVYFCTECSTRAHKRKDRKDHKVEDASTELYTLDLLSVICIETSHYVCFTRDLNTETWIFFDSMANRVCKYWSPLVNRLSLSF